MLIRYFIIFIFFHLLINCKNNQKEEIEYIPKQGYVNNIIIQFDYNRRKNIDLIVTILYDIDNNKVVKFKNTDFKCKVGDPVVIMTNSKDPDDIWIAYKHIFDKEILKDYLQKNKLGLSDFFKERYML